MLENIINAIHQDESGFAGMTQGSVFVCVCVCVCVQICVHRGVCKEDASVYTNVGVIDDTGFPFFSIYFTRVKTNL